MNKYGSVRTWSELCQRTFSSKLEARRGEELALMERGGLIKDLRYQVKFVLSEKPKVTLTIDFSYWEGGEWKLEDTKGVLTRDCRTKLAWLKEKTGKSVILSGGA